MVALDEKRRFAGKRHLWRDTAWAMSPREREAWSQNSRQAVEAHLGDEKVEAVGAFQAPRKWQVGSDFDLIRRVVRAVRGDSEVGLLDLPVNFLLAVTKDKVHVFEYYGRSSRKPKIKHVNDFDRDSITFSTEPPDVAVLELRARGGNQRLRLPGGIPDKERNPSAADVVAALSD